MEKIVRNYLEIKSFSEILKVEKPNNNYFLEKVIKRDFQLNSRNNYLKVFELHLNH